MLHKDPTEFRERFQRWKKGEQVYENGLALPAYEDGKISDEQYISIMEKVAADNYKTWEFENEDQALLHALNDNTYNYRGYYNKYPNGQGNAIDHWTDEFKTVWHPTFSNESVYSGKKSQYNPKGLKGGRWIGEKFIPAKWQKIPQYEDGKSPRKLEYHPEGDYYYGGKVFPDKELVVTGHRKGMARKLYSRPWKTYGDLSRESNEKMQAEIASQGGLERYAIHRDLSKPLSPVDPVGELIVGNAVLGPAFNYVGKGLKSVGNTIVDDALIQAGKSGSKWAKAKAVQRAMGNPIVSTDAHTISPIIRTKVGDVEIDNPGLYYHQSDAGKAKNFISTGRMRTPIEESWLAKEEAGEKIPLAIRSGIKPGYPQSPGMAMFAQGNLWYGLTPKKPDLLVTAREMPIANKNASVMSNKASLRALEMQGPRRVTNDNIYTQGPHNRQNTTAYTWEPGYGYRRIFAEETPTAEWPISRIAPQITTENAANITPAQWTAAQDAAIARGNMAEAQRLRDLHFKISAPKTEVVDINGNPQLVVHKTPNTFTVFDNSRSIGKLNWFATPNAYGENGVFATGAGKNPRTMKLYVNMRNAHKPTIDEGIEPAYINRGEDGLLGIVDKDMTNYFKSSRDAGKGFMMSGGVDNPNALKSADAVTYDNNGVRIPLGKRDNFKLKDIRYGLLPVIGVTGYGMYKSK